MSEHGALVGMVTELWLWVDKKLAAFSPLVFGTRSNENAVRQTPAFGVRTHSKIE